MNLVWRVKEGFLKEEMAFEVWFVGGRGGSSEKGRVRILRNCMS